MIEITSNPIDPSRITARVKTDSNGAVLTFLGVTRNYSGDRKVLHLEYEAYRPMADKKLEQIVEEIHHRWDTIDVAIVHRIGRVFIGEISLIVAVSSPHRKSVFDACQYAVDLVKTMVPIWKKEFFEGGEVWIESSTDLKAIRMQSLKK